jgi:hypothetical protein
MNIVFENEYCLVIDNFLDKDAFSLLWAYIKQEEFTFVHTRKWVSAFRLTDGEPLWSPVYISDPFEGDRSSIIYPTQKAIDLVMQKMISHETFLAKWVGERSKDWAYFSARSYLYPSGTGLSWHRDNKNNVTGAYSFYCHPEWNVQWGGELLVADQSTKNVVFPETQLYGGESTFLGTHLDNSFENEKLLELGIGHYIFPKPNRFVALSSGILHAIKKVDLAAGNHVRASIQGFFLDPNKHKTS